MPNSTQTVERLLAVMDELWPFARAEDWDRVGLVTGSPHAPVSNVLLVVDVTEATMTQAVDGGYDAIIAHHPLLLKSVTSLSEADSKGSLVSRAIRAQCAVVSAHTNADSAVGGVADVLAQRLEIHETTPILGESSDARVGIGRVGLLEAPLQLRDFATRLSGVLPETVSGVRVAGSPEQLVQRVAICPGAGDSLLDHPLVYGADVYVTADLRHHPASETRERAQLHDSRPALIDVSHWASEWLWLEAAASDLRVRLPEVSFTVSDLSTDVWQFSVAAKPELYESES